MPSWRRRAAVAGPTPHSSSIGRGARKAASPEGGTTTKPRGLPVPVAILATSLLVATPNEQGSPIPWPMCCRASWSIANPADWDVSSTKASSMLICWIRGDSVPSTAITRAECSR